MFAAGIGCDNRWCPEYARPDNNANYHGYDIQDGKGLSGRHALHCGLFFLGVLIRISKRD